MARVRIDFGDHGAIGVEAGAFYSWFESQKYMTETPLLVFGSELVDVLHARLHNRYNISKNTIRGTLWRLFEYLDSPISHIPGETRKRVATGLANLFNDDFFLGVWPDRFRRSRRCYVVLAYLAHEWDSVLLAGALREFWLECGNRITMCDPDYYQEWRKARGQLPGWGEDGMLHTPEETMHRGRSAVKWHKNRGLSLPAPKIRHNSGMQLMFPGLSNRAWPSSPMPVGFPIANYFDDIDQLKWQQHAVHNKLDTMDEKLDLMLYRF